MGRMAMATIKSYQGGPRKYLNRNLGRLNATKKSSDQLQLLISRETGRTAMFTPVNQVDLLVVDVLHCLS
jgi:hypothetical protein